MHLGKPDTDSINVGIFYKKNTMNFYVSILFVLVTLIHQHAYAQDYPTRGLIYHTSENSSIQYSCSLQGAELHCDMNQTFVRQQLTENEFPKRLKEMISQLDKEDKDSARFREQCNELIKGMAQVETILKKPENKLTQQEREGIKKMSKHSLNKMREMVALFEAHCRKPSGKTREALASYMVSEETKTCRVGSNYWKEIFVRTKGIESGNFGSNSSWVTKDQPSGPCGIVLTNRWELDDSDKSTKVKFWNYVARKVVTNPSGETMFGMKCNQLDEGSYRYVWQSQEVGLDCRTVRFSPL